MFFIDQYSLHERQQIYNNIKAQGATIKLLPIIVNLYTEQSSLKLLINPNCTASELIIYIRRKCKLPAVSYYLFAQRQVATKHTLLPSNCYIKEIIPEQDNFRYINFLQQDSFGFINHE